MERGDLTADQNFYSRPPIPRPPTASDDTRRTPQPSMSTYDDYDAAVQPFPTFNTRPDNSRPQVPPKVSLITGNLQATGVDSYGGSVGDAYSPAPDDFYRGYNLNPYQSDDYNMTSGAITTPPSSSLPLPSQNQPAFSLQSNGNGTTPKHPTLSSSRDNLNPVPRTVSSPIDQKMAALSSAKSASGLHNGYTKGQRIPSQTRVQDLAKKFDDRKAASSVSRHPPLRPGYRENSVEKPSSYSRVSRAESSKVPPVKFGTEGPYSGNNRPDSMGGVRSPPRVRSPPSSKAMPDISSKASVGSMKTSSPPRRLLFGEVIPSGPVSTRPGYGIMHDEEENGIPDNLDLNQSQWAGSRKTRQDEKPDQPKSPTSPSQWYRGVTPQLLDEIERSPRSRRHNRSQSDIENNGNAIPRTPPTRSRAPSQPQAPVTPGSNSFKKETNTPSSTRSISPFATRAKSPLVGRAKSPYAARSTAAYDMKKQEQRPWSPAGRVRGSSVSHSRSPGRPSHINTANSTLKATINSTPPKPSPPLRGSRTRQSIETATTASSRLKSQKGNALSGGDSDRDHRRDISHAREPSPSRQQLRAAAAKVAKAISVRNNLERERREMRNRQIIAERDAAQSVDSEATSPLTPTLSNPKLRVDTSFSGTTAPPVSLSFKNVPESDSPTLGIPGSFPENDFDDGPPLSALSVATGVTEFDCEQQTEAPRQVPYQQPSFDADMDQQTPSDSGFFSGDRGSIKILLDTSSLNLSEDFASTTANHDASVASHLSIGDEDTGFSNLGETGHRDIHGLNTMTNEEDPILSNGMNHDIYLEHEPFYTEKFHNEQPVIEEAEKWTPSNSQAPSLRLPFLTTSFHTESQESQPNSEYLETPVTEIDYESSDGGLGNGNGFPSSDSNGNAMGGQSSHRNDWTLQPIEKDEYPWHLDATHPQTEEFSHRTQVPTPPPKQLLSKEVSQSVLGVDSSQPRLNGYAEDDVTSDANNSFSAKSPEYPQHPPPPPPIGSVPPNDPDISAIEFVRREYANKGPTLQNDTDAKVAQPAEEKEVLDKQARRLQHRGRVIQEIIDTEAVYLKDMNVVEEIYKGTASACPGLDSKIDTPIIFRNSQDIVTFSTLFLDELKGASASVYSPRQKRRQSKTSIAAAMSPTSDARLSVSTGLSEEKETDFEKDRKTFIGAVFNRHLSEMQEVYSEFLKNSEKASTKLAEKQKQQAVRVWLGECNTVAKDLTAAWDLDALLIKPVQRITRYQLLLKDLLESTPEDHPDYEALKAACDNIGFLLKSIDDLKKRIETVAKIISGGGATRKRKESDVRNGLAKAFGRRDKALLSANRPPEDSVYVQLHRAWTHDYIQLQIILRDVENYSRKATTWVNDYLRYLSGIELVMRAVNAPDEFVHLLSKWARYNVSMRDMSTVALADHVTAVKKQVIEPLEQLIRAYTHPELAMKKREKRRLEYEKSLALKAANKTMDDKMKNLVDEYDALNESLKSELPKLSSLSQKLGKMCITRMVRIQTDWYDTWQVKVRTVLASAEVPESLEEILDNFNREFSIPQKSLNSLSIVNGSLLAETLLQDIPKGRSSQSTQSTSATKEDEPRDSFSPAGAGGIRNGHAADNRPRPRGLSLNSDKSPSLSGLPSLPTPDFRRSSGHEFRFSPILSESPGLPSFSAKDYPPINSRSNNEFPVAETQSSRPGLSRPPTGQSHESNNVPRRSVESSYVPRPPSFSASPYDYASDTPRVPGAYSSRPFSGLFHSAMPPTDVADESQRSSRASSQDRESSDRFNVLYIAASLFEFNISATKTEAGYPYLTYGAGEVFDVIGEKGELWLAKNQDDPSCLVGWIWSKHFARLAA